MLNLFEPAVSTCLQMLETRCSCLLVDHQHFTWGDIYHLGQKEHNAAVASLKPLGVENNCEFTPGSTLEI